MFCSGSNEGGTAAVPVDDDARPQKFIKVLQGLADCVACSGNGIQVSMIYILCLWIFDIVPGGNFYKTPISLCSESNCIDKVLSLLRGVGDKKWDSIYLICYVGEM